MKLKGWLSFEPQFTRNNWRPDHVVGWKGVRFTKTRPVGLAVKISLDIPEEIYQPLIEMTLEPGDLEFHPTTGSEGIS